MDHLFNVGKKNAEIVMHAHTPAVLDPVFVPMAAKLGKLMTQVWGGKRGASWEVVVVVVVGGGGAAAGGAAAAAAAAASAGAAGAGAAVVVDGGRSLT
jgi:hypothetical protein